MSALLESLSFALDKDDDWLSIIFEEFVGRVSQTPSTHSVLSHIPILSHEILVLLSYALTGSGFVKGMLKDKKNIRFKVELLRVLWGIVNLLLRIF